MTKIEINYIYYSIDCEPDTTEPISIDSIKPTPLPRPWEVQAAQSVTDALAELFEEVLSRYVSPWYQMISTEPQFLNECKASLRHGAANLYARILRRQKGFSLYISIRCPQF